MLRTHFMNTRECDGTISGAGQGARSAAWSTHVSDEQRGHAPESAPSLRVGPECGARFPLLVAKGTHPLLPLTGRGSSAFGANASHGYS